MANTEIDSLSLDIQITGLKEQDVKNIDRLSRAVKRLADSLATADFSKLKQIQVPKGISNLTFLTQNFKNTISGISSGEDTQQINQNLSELGDTAQEVANQYDDASLSIENASGDISKNGFRVIKENRRVIAELEGKKAKKTQIEKLTDSITKSLKRFKTIAVIKTIRAILNIMVQAIKTGITNLAQFDKSFNETISNIKTAGTNISDSLVLSFRSLIESLEPFIVSFSQALANISNEISRLQAIMKGTSTYTKINAKYMEDFANASQKAQKFSFDTFETLSGGETNNKFESAETTETEEDKKRVEIIQAIQKLLTSALNIIKLILSEVKKLLIILQPIIKLIGDIGTFLDDVVGTLLEIVFDIVNPLLELIMQLVDPLLNVFKPIIEFIRDILLFIKPIIEGIVELIVDTLKPVVEALVPIVEKFSPIIDNILNLVSAIFEFIGPLFDSAITQAIQDLQPMLEILTIIFNVVNELVETFMSLLNFDFGDFADHFSKLILMIIKGILSVVDFIVNAIIDTINLIFAPINAISDFFDWGWEIGIPHINLASLVPSFAEGGFVGEVWQMNEYGTPEMLYNANNNSNNTAVINQAQLSLAFENAIYNTGLLDAIARAGIIQLDGRTIAQSTNFKNEINRTNPGLNIK